MARAEFTVQARIRRDLQYAIISEIVAVWDVRGPGALVPFGLRGVLFLRGIRRCPSTHYPRPPCSLAAQDSSPTTAAYARQRLRLHCHQTHTNHRRHAQAKSSLPTHWRRSQRGTFARHAA
eukprot:COSAG02_NODE_242_length_27511_cov_501.886364_18_plen_121_part_00